MSIIWKSDEREWQQCHWWTSWTTRNKRPCPVKQLPSSQHSLRRQTDSGNYTHICKKTKEWATKQPSNRREQKMARQGVFRERMVRRPPFPEQRPERVGSRQCPRGRDPDTCEWMNPSTSGFVPKRISGNQCLTWVCSPRHQLTHNLLLSHKGWIST